MPDIAVPGVTEVLGAFNWQEIQCKLNQKGYVLLPDVLSKAQCNRLIAQWENDDDFRKTVIMERFRFGSGVYKYWHYPLPHLIGELRKILYDKLVSVANLWMKQLRLEIAYPDTFNEMLERCHSAGQLYPTPLILKYEQGGHNTLHQDLYGDVFFPFQVTCFLNEPMEDYIGGEFVITEQVPRVQSKVSVLTPRRGDLLILTTRFRPVKGKKGYYRAAIRHGVSEVLSGNRHTAGIIFHDANN